jgi:hypothetical protein
MLAFFKTREFLKENLLHRTILMHRSFVGFKWEIKLDSFSIFVYGFLKIIVEPYLRHDEADDHS